MAERSVWMRSAWWPWLALLLGLAGLLGEWAWQQRALRIRAAVAELADSRGPTADCRAVDTGWTGRANVCADPRWQFAQAQAALNAGRIEEALDRFRQLSDDDAVGIAARYNAAGVLMRQALPLRQGNQPGLALPLIELAKESYKQVLRDAPEHWAARYNLERAQRWIPEADVEELPLTAPRAAERAATTMRSTSQGAP